MTKHSNYSQISKLMEEEKEKKHFKSRNKVAKCWDNS